MDIWLAAPELGDRNRIGQGGSQRFKMENRDRMKSAFPFSCLCQRTRGEESKLNRDSGLCASDFSQRARTEKGLVAWRSNHWPVFILPLPKLVGWTLAVDIPTAKVRLRCYLWGSSWCACGGSGMTVVSRLMMKAFDG